MENNMNVKEALKLVESVKAKRKGIDKDTKDRIKLLVKNGAFNEDKMNSHWLSDTAWNILLMNDNDYFNPKEIATVLLKDAEKQATQWPSELESVLKVVIHSDTDRWTGGLNNQAWAREIIEYGRKNFDLNIADLIGISKLLIGEDDGNDKKAGSELLVSLVKDAEDMCRIAQIVGIIFDFAEDEELAIKVILDAIDNKVPYDVDFKTDFQYLSDELKEALNKNDKTKDLFN